MDHAYRYRLRQVGRRGPGRRDAIRHRHRRPRAGDAHRGGRHPPARGPPAPLPGPRRPPRGHLLGFTVAGRTRSCRRDRARTIRDQRAPRLGAEARSRRVREFVAFDDPFGNRLELVSQQETVARPVAFSRGAGITEFGHLCLDAPDVHRPTGSGARASTHGCRTGSATRPPPGAVDERHRVRHRDRHEVRRAVGQHPQRGALQVVRHLGQRPCSSPAISASRIAACSASPAACQLPGSDSW